MVGYHEGGEVGAGVVEVVGAEAWRACCHVFFAGGRMVERSDRWKMVGS